MLALNPGSAFSGGIPGATRRQARSNLDLFLQELRRRVRVRAVPAAPSHKGWFGYRLSSRHGCSVVIEMPGCGLSEVYAKGDDFFDGLWRIYVVYERGQSCDSWYWPFALNEVRFELRKQERKR